VVTPLLLITAKPFLKSANIFVENNRKLVPQYRDICITSLFQCLPRVPAQFIWNVCIHRNKNKADFCELQFVTLSRFLELILPVTALQNTVLFRLRHGLSPGEDMI
jgi:hypothetical protein